jgi:hypothetical protein
LWDGGRQEGMVEMGLKWGSIFKSSGRETERTGKSQVVMNKGFDRKSHKETVYGVKFVSVMLTPS